MDIFLYAPTSCRIWNTQRVQHDEQLQLMLVAIYLMVSRTSMNFLLIIKVKFLVLIKWSSYVSSNHDEY
jgi:hypothetical protein